MAIIKRFHKKNGKKKIFYQAQVYVRGVRLTYRSFNTKAEAVIWHEMLENHLQNNTKLKFLSNFNKIKRQ